MKKIIYSVLVVMMLMSCTKQEIPPMGVVTTTTNQLIIPPMQEAGVVIGLDDVTFDKKTGTILTYIGSSENIIIPETIDGVEVLIIGKRSFSYKNIKHVKLPDTLITIESSAFDQNQLAGELVIPSSVVRIEEFAFSGTLENIFNNIDTITFQSGSKLTFIGVEAFGHNNLTKLQLPEGITHIRANAFANNRLSSFNIPNSVEVLEVGSFNRNAMVGEDAFIYRQDSNGIDKKVLSGYAGPKGSKDITIPEQVEEIMAGAFSHSFLTGTLTINRNVQTIGYGAFDYNDFDEFVIPEDSKLEILHKFALSGVNAATMMLPKSLKQIKEGALSWKVKKILNLTSMTVQDFVRNKVVYAGLCELKAVGDSTQRKGQLDLCNQIIDVVTEK